MTNKNFNFESNLGVVELSSSELENTNGGVVVAITLGAALWTLGGSIVVGAAIGYGVASAIEWME